MRRFGLRARRRILSREERAPYARRLRQGKLASRRAYRPTVGAAEHPAHAKRVRRCVGEHRRASKSHAQKNAQLRKQSARMRTRRGPAQKSARLLTRASSRFARDFQQRKLFPSILCTTDSTKSFSLSTCPKGKRFLQKTGKPIFPNLETLKKKLYLESWTATAAAK